MFHIEVIKTSLWANIQKLQKFIDKYLLQVNSLNFLRFRAHKFDMIFAKVVYSLRVFKLKAYFAALLSSLLLI